MLPQIAQWLLLVDGLMSFKYFSVPLDPGEEPFAAAVFHCVRGELDTCLSLAGRRWPLASGFRHVGLLGRWFLAFIAQRLVIRV